LRAPLGDYGISRNDVLTISISDLQSPGTETMKQTRVSETGNISLPYIKQIRAEGLTEMELEQQIVEAYRRARLVDNANVSVSVFEARGRSYSITGAVRTPNLYAIPEADYRVLNALTAAGGTDSPFNRTLYIIRRLDERPRPAVSPDAMQPAGAGPGTMTPGGTTTPSTGPGTGTDDLAPRSRSEATPPGGGRALAAGHGEKVMLLTQAQPGGAADPDQRIINLDGQELPARRPESDDATPAAPRTGRSAPAPGARTGTASGAATGSMSAAGEGRRATGSSGSFEFNDLAPAPETRVIRIPLDELRNGDLKYNIVIRPRDTLVVPYAEIGTYYMGGHVSRPGAYALNGQRVTLMDAVIAASMLDQLAIPNRTDLVRRIGPDRQVFVRVDLAKVFAGTAPDVYLKPDDKVLVGTSWYAPFVAALRNSFRFTYGAGFIYDKNFAYSDNFQTR
jgi:polysaccharide export outer membrane protein